MNLKPNQVTAFLAELFPAMGARVTISWNGGQEGTSLKLAVERLEAPSKTSGPLKLPLPFDNALTSDRHKRAVHQLVSADYLSRRAFERGKLLKYGIPDLTPPNQPKHTLKTPIQLNSFPINVNNLVRAVLLPPPDFSDLYPYQSQGVTWLLSGDARLLADDMGLGKTVQTIRACSLLIHAGQISHVVVLAPKSLVLNWVAEFRKWAPELACVGIAPNPTVGQNVWELARQKFHVVISNYEQMRNSREYLGNDKIDLLICDEAHRLRNETSQVSAGVRAISRSRLWALSGTPIERDIEDFATLMSLLDPRRFSVSDPLNTALILRDKAAPYILRRTRSAVLPELPRVTERTESIGLLEPQQERYTKALGGISNAGGAISNPLQIINELRMICDFDPQTNESAKAQRILQLIRDISTTGEKVIVFSYLIQPLEILSRSLKKSEFRRIDGSMSTYKRESAVVEFKDDPEVCVLLASSRVASEGLTLTEANHVIFMNRWWNPSANQQARDRVNRIGQSRPVFIYNFVTVDTIEEKLQDLLQRKDKTYNDVLGRLANPKETFDSDEQRFIALLLPHHSGKRKSQTN